MSIRVVGIDFSLTGTGVARVVDGKINTAEFGREGKLEESLTVRLNRIRRVVKQTTEFALQGHDPEVDPKPLFVIEGPSLHSKFGMPWERAGGWWLVLHLLEKHGLIVEVPPTSLKSYIASKGTAGKPEVMSAVSHALNLVVTSNNVADALALAAMGQRQLGRPLEVSTSRIRFTALDAIRWPQLVERD